MAELLLAVHAAATISEILSWLIPLPIPAGIYGLVLLFVLLCLKIVRLEWVENAADFMLAVMPIMFVPAASSLMTKWHLIKNDVAGLLITSVVSTAIVMAVSGLVTQLIIRRKKAANHSASSGEGAAETENKGVK